MDFRGCDPDGWQLPGKLAVGSCPGAGAWGRAPEHGFEMRFCGQANKTRAGTVPEPGDSPNVDYLMVIPLKGLLGWLGRRFRPR